MRAFRGKTAVITGAASGIGAALARRAGAEGMHVVLADVSVPEAEAVERLQDLIREHGKWIEPASAPAASDPVTV